MISSLLLLFRVISYLDIFSRIRLFLNLLLSIISSVFEFLSLSSALLFFSILFTGQISEITFVKEYLPFVIDLPSNYLVLLFIAATCLSGFIRIWCLKNTFYLSGFLSNKLSSLAFSKLLGQSYTYHLAENSSFQVSILTNDVGLTVGAFNSLLQGISACLSLIAIIFTIVFVIHGQAIIFLSIIPIIYFVLYLFYSRRFKTNSEMISFLFGKQLDFVKDSLMSIRSILLSHDQPYFVNTFQKNDKRLRDSQAYNHFVASYPKTTLEIIAISLFALIFLIFPSLASTRFLPVFASLALALQKLFPLFQSIYQNISTIQICEAGVSNLLSLLKLRVPDQNCLESSQFSFNSLKLFNVDYSYPNTSNLALSKFSLEVFRGDKIGIHGPSGSGKSTLVDILMLLLPPSNGTLNLNDKSLYSQTLDSNRHDYQNHISHVPQNIYLIDSDIITNIVGINSNHINHEALELALKVSSLDDFVNSLPKKLNSRVGENGALLSGGQKQRVGLAREIYKMNPILVLDEATSAIDPETENKILSSLFSLNHIELILFISHNYSSLKHCNRIIRVDNSYIHLES
tara:strand:- start:5966 stop:7684 length:1719 start_codon:yes stop_codon:yes gene_type:complete